MLRPYQQTAIDSVREAYASGAKRVVLVLPTGAGKTVIGRAAAEKHIAKGGGVLWLAHRRELVDQAAAEMPGKFGLILAGRPRSDGPVQIATIQTIVSRECRPPATMLVLDEAHHVAANTWRDVVSKYPNAHVLGLTATPERGDGQPLGDIFDRLVTGPAVRELVTLGHLVEPEVIAPDKTSTTLAMLPVKAWQTYADGRQGLVFAKTVEQSRRIADELTDAGFAAEHVDAETPTPERELAISKFRAGDVRALCSVYVFTEGFDTLASVCMIARGCQHASTYLQMIGRIMRPSRDKRATVIDLMGSVHRHGLPADERTYSLDGRAISRLKALPLWQCRACGYVLRERPDECPRCGEVAPLIAPPAVKEQRLDRVLRPGASRGEKQAALERLMNVARERGYNLGWAQHKFRATFGHWPERGR